MLPQELQFSNSMSGKTVIPGGGGAGAGGRLDGAAGGLCAGRARAFYGARRGARAGDAVGVAVVCAHPDTAHEAEGRQQRWKEPIDCR